MKYINPKSIIPFVFIIIVLLTGCCRANALKGDQIMSKDNLHLTIKLDKHAYHVGEQIKIKYIVTNNSEKDIYFINWDYGFIVEWIYLLDLDLNELKRIPKVIYTLPRYLEKEQYVLIKPNKSLTIEIVGEIKRDIFRKHGRIPYEGLGIDFEDSAILTKGIGIYFIEGRYKISASFAKEGKEIYGLDNIWTGQLKSNRIKIEIIE